MIGEICIFSSKKIESWNLKISEVEHWVFTAPDGLDGLEDDSKDI